MENKLTFNQFINQEKTMGIILKRVCNDKQMAVKFIGDLTSTINMNPALKECENGSIMSCGFAALALNLPLNPAFQRCYIVPYKKKEWIGGQYIEKSIAQFQVSYKGLRELAMRSGAYSNADAKAIHQSEFKGRNKITGDAIIEFRNDYNYGENDKVVGYYAYLIGKDGSTETLYMTNEDLEKHGKKYSKSYGSGKATDLWKHEFDTMAKKTVLKLLLARKAILSTEIMQALKYDQAEMLADGTANYVDRKQEELIETHTNNFAEHLESLEKERGAK